MIRRLVSTFILKYLRFFAKLAISYKRPKHIIGIAGSLGKSSVRNMVDVLLKDQYFTKTIFEGNSQTGVPLGILNLKIVDYSFFDWIRLLILIPFKIFCLRNVDVLIIEMGIDSPVSPKNMSYLLSIVKPDIAVILNIHPVHTERFEPYVNQKGGKLNNQVLNLIAAEKCKIVSENENCRVVIYNDANYYVKETVRKVAYGRKSLKVIRFGKTTRCDIRLQSYKVSFSGTRMTFNTKNGVSMSLNINGFILPDVYQEVFAAAILVAQNLGIKNEKIVRLIEQQFSLPKSRASILMGQNNVIIIDSSYNASKASVSTFIDLLKSLKKMSNHSFIFIFGDMKELGKRSIEDHKSVALQIDNVFDRVYLTGQLTKLYVLPYLSKVSEKKWFETSQKIGEYLKDNLPEESVILAKGSQNEIFIEEALKPLLRDSKDISFLCRQSPYWLAVKKRQSLKV